ncbi:SprT family zinc-dependent metalloprotease [Spartinivicinus ruber]|uniref:SprT family zinc-dependent metalloprotease n=1 Tax=Spartinivicinus ruber TaxID=2683272 RepID=UPI0013CFF21E|nr:SprT-like domain-containing protein [Spartinivicinus ruber]
MLEDAVIKRVRVLICLAETRFGRMFQMPTIRFDLKGTCAGTADWLNNEVRFNPLFLTHHQQHFITHTVAHEVAHLVAPLIYGSHIKPHGEEWQFVMEEVFCCPAERCHQYDLSTVNNQRPYHCQCAQPVWLGPIQHKRAQQGARYICKQCRQPLEAAASV